MTIYRGVGGGGNNFDDTTTAIFEALAAQAAQSASSSAASAGQSSSSATSALATKVAVNDKYFGALAADPAVAPSGAALAAGMEYFNTVTKIMRVYSGTAFQDASSSATAATQVFSGTGAQVAFTLSIAPRSVSNTQVYISGVYQQKASYGVSGAVLTFSAAPAAGTNNIEVVSLAPTTSANTSASFVDFTDNEGVVGTVAGLATRIATKKIVIDGKNVGAVSTDIASLTSKSETAAVAEDIYEGVIGPGGVPAPTFDAVRGVMISPAGTTVIGSSAVAGYIQNRTVQGTFGQNTFSGGVALLGVGISDADNTSTWGLATIVSDRTNQAVATGLGRFCFNEMDFNITSPDTTVSGLILGGTWLAQPKSATGVTVFKPVGLGTWQYAFGTQAGATAQALRVGRIAASGNNVNSQNIDMYWSTPTGVEKFTEIQAQGSGLVIASSEAPSGSRTPGSIILANGGIYLNPILAPNTPGAGQFIIYNDAADSKLKARGSNGTITILASL